MVELTQQTFPKKVKRYGNSMVVVIPAFICDMMSLKENQFIEVTLKKFSKKEAVIEGVVQ